MWSQIQEKFKGYPAQFSVARKMIELGLSLDNDGKVFCNDLEISNVALAKSANVDRRVINSTAQTILNDSFLFNVFSNMSTAGPLLKNIAKSLKLGVIEVTADSQNSGLLGEVANLISSKKINIRQAYAGDIEIEDIPKLVIITESSVPGDIINEILELKGAIKVSIY